MKKKRETCEIFVCSSADKHLGLGAKCSQEEKPEFNQKRKRSKRGERADKRGGGGELKEEEEAKRGGG